ncbi:hypothetical protein GCM10007301_40210 [Azorhizobium oxalatiphilum]|uniref:DUF2125 domain-containing protein n=1 Tax=Azorhizobium oxalatiphilum TaxID=980631 RepID=A0A917CAY6_9HYPH|nr:DUF2125 domain-containing protein [Azorhizobium oxalatiphilum]GGF76216.1 hypothetical protein GCM10007301_40210 [Azorhizobium oxalatiphilum]
MSVTEPAARRRRPWIIALPLILLILVGIGWSGLWIYAARTADGEIDAWIAREKQLGRTWSCSERSLEGFPFRFELMCRDPVLVTQGGDSFRISAAAAHAVAQIWDPSHIVAEFASPARVEDQATGQVYTVSWSLLQMSGIGDNTGRPVRFDLVANNPMVEQAPGTASATPMLSAKQIETHARRNPGANGARDGVDFAFSIAGGESPQMAAAGSAGPLDLALQMTLTAADDMRPMPVEDRLRAWAMAGGMMQLQALTLTTPKAAANISGALLVDPQGMLNGQLSLGFSGIEDVLKNLASAGLVSQEYVPIVSALAMAGKRGDVAGRPGVTFNVGFDKGALKLGRIPVGRVPALFPPPVAPLPPPAAMTAPTVPVTPGPATPAPAQ